MNFNLKSEDGDEIWDVIETVSTIVSINQAISQVYHIRYGVVRVSLDSSEDALMVVEGIDGCEFRGKCLSASVKGI